MSKTKSTSKASKPTKSDVLTKVKDAGVTKSSKDSKTKSKVVAKEVAAKEDKKSKKSKKVKEPSPEPSSEDDSDNSASSDSDSESEPEAKPTKTANGKAAKAADSDVSESSESDSSDDEAPAPKKGDKKQTNGAVAKKDESSDSDSDSDEEGAPVNGVLGKAPAVDEASDSDGSDSDDEAAPSKAEKEADSDSDSDSGSSSDDDEEEDTPAVKTNKRKADDEAEAATKKPKTENNGSKNLFVGNLSWGVNEDWLREEFEVYGELSGVRIVTDRDSGRSKGFGYIEYVNADDAQKAFEAKKGSELDNRPLNIDWASAKPDNKDKQEDRRKSYGDQLSEPSDTLFVGNLSFDVGQESVSEAFAPYGTISSVRLPTDINTGMAKGFGYVTFSTVDEAKGALESMQGGYIGSRPIRLDYSQPRPERQDGGFGGGRGGGRGRGGFGGRGRGGDRGGRGFGGRGRGGDRGGRGGRGGSTNRGGFGDFSGKRQTFD